MTKCKYCGKKMIQLRQDINGVLVCESLSESLKISIRTAIDQWLGYKGEQ